MRGLREFSRRDWTGLKQVIAACPPDEAYAVITAIGERSTVGQSLSGLVAGEEDAVGLTIAGGVTAIWAGRARGGAVASLVTESQAEAHMRLLDEAGQLLMAALAADARSGLAAALLLRVGAYLGGEAIEHAEAQFQAADNPPVAAFLNLLSARTAKWFGSEAEMWETARKYEDWSLPGSKAVLALAHYEQWLQLAAFSDTQEDRRRAVGYFQEPQVRAELRAASELALSTPTGDPYNAWMADGWLGRVLLQGGQPKRAKLHFQRLGRFADRNVWNLGLSGGPRINLARHRIAVGLWP